MKRTITLLFVCFSIFSAAAQVTFKPGARAGLNLSNFTNTDFDTKTDFYVGGFLAINFTKYYTLQPELTYSRQGAKSGNNDYSTALPDVNDPAFRPPGEKDFSVQYLSLAAMNKFYFGGGGFHAAVGPSLDFKVGDNFSGVNEDLVGVDLAFNAGLGYTLPMGLTIEARYKIGLVDIFGNNVDYNYDYYYDDNGNIDDVVLNSVIQLGVAYTF